LRKYEAHLIEFQQIVLPKPRRTSACLPGRHMENTSGRSLSWSRDCGPGQHVPACRRGRLSSASLQDLSRLEDGWPPVPHPRQLHCCRQHCRPGRHELPALWHWPAAVPSPGKTFCSELGLRPANCGDLFMVEQNVRGTGVTVNSKMHNKANVMPVRPSGYITTEV
jgi:hypothetical protein